MEEQQEEINSNLGLASQLLAQEGPGEIHFNPAVTLSFPTPGCLLALSPTVG